MATMITEIYTALKDIGVSDEKAQRAAEAMAVDSPRLTRLEGNVDKIVADVSVLKADGIVIKAEVAGLKADSAMMKWMLGFVLAMNVAILFRLFAH